MPPALLKLLAVSLALLLFAIARTISGMDTVTETNTTPDISFVTAAGTSPGIGTITGIDTNSGISIFVVETKIGAVPGYNKDSIADSGTSSGTALVGYVPNISPVNSNKRDTSYAYITSE